MRLLPLFKFSSRAKSTSIGIALCTMFIVASFSIAGGLENSMDKLVSSFDSEYYLVTRSNATGMTFFDATDVQQIDERVALGIATRAFVLPYEESVTVFSISDPFGILPTQLGPKNDTVLKSTLGYSLGAITLVGAESLDLTLSGGYSSSIFPSDWLLTSQNITWALTEQAGEYNFAVGKSLSGDEVRHLLESGFSVQTMIGIIAFLDSGVNEISSDMLWVLLPSAFVIAVLAYSFIGSEVVDRRHEIGILKTIGAGRYRILSYLLGNAVLICLWGSLLGIALGIVLSYAISTAASTMFTSVFILQVDELLIGVSFLVTVGAGIIGALFPAVGMTISSPVDDLKEGDL